MSLYTSHLLTASQWAKFYKNFPTCLEIPAKKSDEREPVPAPRKPFCIFIGLNFSPCKNEKGTHGPRGPGGEMTAKDNCCRPGQRTGAPCSTPDKTKVPQTSVDALKMLSLTYIPSDAAGEWKSELPNYLRQKKKNVRWICSVVLCRRGSEVTKESAPPWRNYLSCR